MSRAADIDAALIAYLGYKRADRPQADWRAVVEAIGLERAEAAEIPMLGVLADLRAIEPDWASHSLWSGSEWAVRELRKRHPEIGDGAVKALVWAFSCDQQ